MEGFRIDNTVSVALKIGAHRAFLFLFEPARALPRLFRIRRQKLENIDDYYVKLVEQAETAQNWESTDSVETPQDRENEDSTPPRAE